MPQTTLSPGPSTFMLQNVVYTLPARVCYIFSDAALQISNDGAFSSSQAVTANTPTIAAGTFVRCTGSNAVVRLTSF